MELPGARALVVLHKLSWEPIRWKSLKLPSSKSPLPRFACRQVRMQAPITFFRQAKWGRGGTPIRLAQALMMYSVWGSTFPLLELNVGKSASKRYRNPFGSSSDTRGMPHPASHIYPTSRPLSLTLSPKLLPTARKRMVRMLATTLRGRGDLCVALFHAPELCISHDVWNNEG